MEEAAAAAALLSELPFDADDDEVTESRRSICYGGCGRPSAVCLCPYLPSKPIPTSTQILLLHHPHSLSNNTNTLSTVPPLTSSLLNIHPISGRKLRLGSHPLLDSLYHQDNHHPALFLFPPLPSCPYPLPLSHWTPPPNPILIVFDGTWRQAREMVSASMPFLKSISATHVTIGECGETAEGPSSYEDGLVVRKEPFKGCVSTLEAVARALRVLEGKEVEEMLLRVLRAMVGFQREHLKPEMKARIKMKKKKKVRMKVED